MKLLLYCTKAKPYLYSFMGKLWEQNKKLAEEVPMLNGKIVAECDFEVEKIVCDLRMTKEYRFFDEYTTKSLSEKELLYASKIDRISFINYLKGKNGYAIHIKNLHIFDKPKELSDYNQLIKGKSKGALDVLIVFDDTKKAPQNMMYVYDRNTVEKYALISIRPEWLCKILNGEKTVEIRKKVLKEMLNEK